MALMEWTPTLSVKVKQFDDQHKKLVDLINQLHESMKAGHGLDTLGDVLQSLISYTASHFANEEKLMQAHAYPDYARHKAAHDSFVKDVLNIQKKFQAGDPMVSMSVRSMLKDWIINHIQGEDKKYSDFFNKKGIS